jgi:hypothetical protein
MARRQSTSAARARGNARERTTRASNTDRVQRCSPGHKKRLGKRADVEAALEQGRTCLVQAESVLVCLHSALLYSERATDPDYAGVAGIALSLVRRLADLLDSSNLQGLPAPGNWPAGSERSAARPMGRGKAVAR